MNIAENTGWSMMAGGLFNDLERPVVATRCAEGSQPVKPGMDALFASGCRHLCVQSLRVPREKLATMPTATATSKLAPLVSNCERQCPRKAP